ncbi:MAG: flagellar biosynthetic protein FliQ [Myxococcota bacterium]
MNIDQAIALMTELIENTIFIAGPILGAALVGGVVMGILQTATQINEMSVSYVVKAACVLAVFLIGGTTFVSKAVTYTKQSFAKIADVVVQR